MRNKNVKNVVEELRNSLSSAEATANYLGLDEVTMLIGVARLSLQDQLFTNSYDRDFEETHTELVVV